MYELNSLTLVFEVAGPAAIHMETDDRIYLLCCKDETKVVAICGHEDDVATRCGSSLTPQCRIKDVYRKALRILLQSDEHEDVVQSEGRRDQAQRFRGRRVLCKACLALSIPLKS